MEEQAGGMDSALTVGFCYLFDEKERGRLGSCYVFGE